MKRSTTPQHWWLLILVGGFILLVLILGNQFNTSEKFIVPIIVIGLLIFGAMAIWMRANAHSTGDEWWQDDSSTGWRGY